MNAFAIEEALQMHESNGYWTLSSKKAWGILGGALGLWGFESLALHQATNGGVLGIKPRTKFTVP